MFLINLYLYKYNLQLQKWQNINSYITLNHNNPQSQGFQNINAYNFI
jgi:hypothetical protein